jgi:hypothetical protein
MRAGIIPQKYFRTDHRFEDTHPLSSPVLSKRSAIRYIVCLTTAKPLAGLSRVNRSRLVQPVLPEQIRIDRTLFGRKTPYAISALCRLDLMPAIHFDYVIAVAAIDIVILLAVSIGIVAEMHRNRPRRKHGDCRMIIKP